MVLTPFLFIYFNNNIMGIKYHKDCNNNMYSDSVVLVDTWVCSLEVHITGQPT